MMLIRNAVEIIAVMDKMAHDIEARLRYLGIKDPLMVGIHTGGVWIAQYLHQSLALTQPLGTLDISFYRDDFTRIGMHPQVKPSSLPFSIENRHLILVDDVLHSGRTIRAAMNVLFDYGRPARILLAVLVDRNSRELPVQADIIGQTLELKESQHVKLTGPDPLELYLHNNEHL